MVWLARFSRQSKIVAATGAAAVIAAAIAVVIGVSGGTSADESPHLPAIVVHTGAEEGEQENIRAVTSLLSGLPAAVAAGSVADRIGPGPASDLALSNLQTVLPSGTTIAVDAASWRRTGLIAMVTVRVSRPNTSMPESHVVVLVHVDGRWFVSSTRRAETL